MPTDTVTCPSCNTTLRPKTPVPAGTRLKCPKCSTTFVTPADEELATAAAPRPARAATEDAGYADETEGMDAPDRDRDAPVKRKKKKGGIPLWAWLVGSGGLLVLLCGGGCCIGSMFVPTMMGIKQGGESANVNQANFDKITSGMTEAQVKAIMGEPTTSGGLMGVQVDTWKSGDDAIAVTFQKDAAMSSTYQTKSGTKIGISK
jgi:SmpA / OmlA family